MTTDLASASALAAVAVLVVLSLYDRRRRTIPVGTSFSGSGWRPAARRASGFARI
jgi:hypothetical protein